MGRVRALRRHARRRPRHQPAAPRREGHAHGGHGVRAFHLGHPGHRPGRLHRPGQRSLLPHHRPPGQPGAGPVALDVHRRPPAGQPPQLHHRPAQSARQLGRRDLAQTPGGRQLPGLGRHHRRAGRRRRPGQLRLLLQRHQRAQGQRTAHPPPGLLRRPDPPAQPHPVPGPPAHRPAARRAARGMGGADVPRPRPLQADQRLPRPCRRRPHAQGSGGAPGHLRGRGRHRGAHGRRRVHPAAATPRHPRRRAEPGHPRRRADPRQPRPSLRPRRPRILRHRQHRHRPLAPGRPRAEPVDEERRHRHVPRQGARQEQLPVLPGGHERQRPGAPGTGKRPASRPRTKRIRSLLPTPIQWRRQAPDRHRGPVALASSAARTGTTG
ncbi:hypothetical protein D3C84_577430 [compost metagenome]